MILFPMAKDITYDEGSLSFTLIFFNKEEESNIQVNMVLDESLKRAIENQLFKESM